MTGQRVRLKRPQAVPPYMWQLMGRGVRLAVMAAYESDPLKRARLTRASLEHGNAQLEQALRDLEKVKK